METLIFIYNAKSDFWSKSLDMAHKIISPDTYACYLCSLTHDSFSEKEIWKSFREKSSVELIFMYKNEFLKKYPGDKEYDFPMILQEQQQRFAILLDSKKITSFKSVEELIVTLQKKISTKKF